MGLRTNIKVKAIRYFKGNKKRVIFVAIIVWLVIVIINQILKHQPEKIEAPFTTYKPHISVINNEIEVPEKYQEPIENKINTYLNYCNNKQYEEAYSMITSECRRVNYPTLDEFKGYVNAIFGDEKKIFNIQNYSVVGDKYIYNVRILDDILATGTTGGYSYYEEKYTLMPDGKDMKLSIANFIGEENLNIGIEDDYMNIKITSKSIDYDQEIYTVEVINKTNNYLVLSDNYQVDEILMDYGANTRRPTNMALPMFFVNPNSSTKKEIVFSKYYDDSSIEALKLIFNNVRVFKEYDWQEGTTQNNIDNAVKIYSLEMSIK